MKSTGLLLIVLTLSSVAIAAPRPCAKAAQEAALNACEKDFPQSTCFLEEFSRLDVTEKKVTYYAHFTAASMGFDFRSYSVEVSYTRLPSGKYSCNKIRVK